MIQIWPNLPQKNPSPPILQVWRGRIHPSSRDLSSACQRTLSAIYFKLRRLRPCVLADLHFQADLDEENELQLCIYGTAISLGGSAKALDMAKGRSLLVLKKYSTYM